jgi:hypothetical protein
MAPTWLASICNHPDRVATNVTLEGSPCLKINFRHTSVAFFLWYPRECLTSLSLRLSYQPQTFLRSSTQRSAPLPRVLLVVPEEHQIYSRRAPPVRLSGRIKLSWALISAFFVVQVPIRDTVSQTIARTFVDISSPISPSIPYPFNLILCRVASVTRDTKPKSLLPLAGCANAPTCSALKLIFSSYAIVHYCPSLSLTSLT